MLWSDAITAAIKKAKLFVILLSEPALEFLVRDASWDTALGPLQVAFDRFNEGKLQILPIFIGQVMGTRYYGTAPNATSALETPASQERGEVPRGVRGV